MVEGSHPAKVTKLDGEREEAWRTFITAYGVVMERIERELAEAGLPPLGWYDVLLELSVAPQRRLRMHELASAVVLSRSGLAALDKQSGRRVPSFEGSTIDRCPFRVRRVLRIETPRRG